MPCTNAASAPASRASGRWSSVTIRLIEKKPPRPRPTLATQSHGASAGSAANPMKPAACSASVSHSTARRSGERFASIGIASAPLAWNSAIHASRLPLACGVMPMPR